MNDTETTLRKIASETLDHFYQKVRDDGREFWLTKDATPSWVKDLCREAHDTGHGHYMMPNDDRYDMIVDSLGILVEAEDEEGELEGLDAAVPVYTHDLTEWLGSHGERPGYCDEAAEEMGLGSDQDTVHRLSMGYLQELREVFASVKESLQDRLDLIEDVDAGS